MANDKAIDAPKSRTRRRWRRLTLLAALAPAVFLIGVVVSRNYLEDCLLRGWYIPLFSGALIALFFLCAAMLFGGRKLAVTSAAAIVICIAAAAGRSAYHYLTVEHYKRLDTSIGDDDRVNIVAGQQYRIRSRMPAIGSESMLDPIAGGVENALDPPPGEFFHIYRTGDSNEVYKMLFDGDMDLIFAPPPTEEQLAAAKDRGLVCDVTPFARDAFVFFVNRRNPVAALSSGQIRDIYSGRITRWEELGAGTGKIKPFQYSEGCCFQQMLRRITGDVPLIPPLREIQWGNGKNEIVDDVANYRNHPGALGFSFRFFTNEMVRSGDIKLLALDGVEPTEENIRNGSYPFVSDCCVVTVRPRDENIRRIVDFLRSPAGYELIEKTGYVPLAAARPADGAAKWETRFVGERTELSRDGAALDFRSCLAEQLHRHPAMQAEDVLKQCYQGAYGPGHILGHAAEAKKHFAAEFSAVAPRPDEPLFEVISPDFMRINLGAWKIRKLPPEWLFNLFSASARHFDDGDAVFRACLNDAENLLSGDLRERFRRLASQSTGAPHHSETYRKAEHPSYRLVGTRFIHALPVLLRAAALPKGDAPKVIAVDGRAASGKTTLARQLAQVMGAGVVHMDDFFLPPELRTAERYREPGGNVHYERFAAEVLPNLKRPEGFSYRVFDCAAMRYGDTTTLKPGAWRIVEGAYSLHPRFGDYADLKVFYDIPPAEQMRRITLRNGEARARVFKERWIPLEELYIRECDVAKSADLIIGSRD